MGVLAYLALVVVVPALLLGHQGQDFPPWRRLRTLRPSLPRRAVCVPAGGPHSPSSDSRDHPEPPRPAQRRTSHPAPTWARTEDAA